MATNRYFILKDEGLLVVEGSYFNEFFYTIKFGNTYYLMERATGVKIALSSNYDDFKNNYEKIMVEYKDYLNKAGLYNTARYVTSRSLANDEKIYNYIGDRPDPFKNDVDFSTLEKWDLEKDGRLSSRPIVRLQEILNDEKAQKKKETPKSTPAPTPKKEPRIASSYKNGILTIGKNDAYALGIKKIDRYKSWFPNTKKDFDPYLEGAKVVYKYIKKHANRMTRINKKNAKRLNRSKYTKYTPSVKPKDIYNSLVTNGYFRYKVDVRKTKYNQETFDSFYDDMEMGMFDDD